MIKPVSAFRDGEGRVCRHLTYSLSLGTFVREVEGTACREQGGASSLRGQVTRRKAFRPGNRRI